MRHWLMKSEPETFSITALKKAPKQTTHWEGVRNYQARNFMRDDMKIGDRVLFYHSNCEVPGVVGIAEVVREAYPDFTAWDPKSDYHDPKSSEADPRWVMVDLRYVETFKRVVSLAELKEHPDLTEMKVVQRGQRLSVQPVTPREFEIVCKLGRQDSKD